MDQWDPRNMTPEELENAANKTYPGIAMFARDVNLPEALAQRYTPGQIIREKAFTDASSRFMGMAATHRYVILSNHMADLSPFEKDTHWGLCVANKDSHFKVLGRYTWNGKTGIFLLHLPDDESWKLWRQNVQMVFHGGTSMEEQLYQKAVQRFVAKCGEPPVPELTAAAWLERCAFPVGMDNQGNFWPLEDRPAASQPGSPSQSEMPSQPGGPVQPGKSPQPAASRPVASPRKVLRDRYRGCLLGGAVGDALGYPVEFVKEETIWSKYGPQGIQTLEQAGDPAQISDDTQMTLFAANAMEYSRTNGMNPTEALWLAWREWLGTQGDTSRMENPSYPRMWLYRVPALHARRAPGNTCLNAIRTSHHGGTMAQPVNNSKGCGTVMRAAPFGLAVSAAQSKGVGLDTVRKLAAADAALTHGHPMAWLSSSVLAQIVYQVVQKRPERNYPLEEAVLSCRCPGDEGGELMALLERAVRLAQDASVSDLDGIHLLGQGWVAEEALAIAVFCAVRYQKDFAAALRASVNHKGDSDSTGAVCGNILGAWLGEQAVEAAFDLNRLELRDVVKTAADRLLEAVEGPEPRPKKAVEGPEPRPEKAVEGPEPRLKKAVEGPEPRPEKAVKGLEPRPTKSTGPAASPAGQPALAPLRPVGLRYTPMTKKALAICWNAHRNQQDKGGLPYFIHPLHLAEQMETEEEVCAALLHDVLEDSSYTLDSLRQAGFPPAVLEAVSLLTRDIRMHYLDYVARLRRNPIARRVKLADLRHNSDQNRLEAVTEQSRRRLLRYRMALAILEDDRYDPFLGHYCKRIPLSLEGVYYLSVFYDPQGRVEKYSWDMEQAEDSHYEFGPDGGERLRQALNPSRTLPEALAERMPMHTRDFEGWMQRLGIPYQPFHFD